MKKTLIQTCIALAIITLSIPANAQTTLGTNAPPTIPNAISTVTSWLGNVNTNYSFNNTIFWDGPIYENQINVANEIGASYDIWHSTTATNPSGTLFLAAEGRFRQAGIAGAWLSESGGAEFGWEKYDTRIGLFLDCAYLDKPAVTGSTSRMAAEGGAFADKMLSSVSAVGLFISGQSQQKYPLIGAHLTVTFGNGKGLFGLF